MQAEAPRLTGHVVRDGVRVAYEVYGDKGPTLVLLPCWIIVHARQWKAQIADLASDCRLIVVEGRGNGASDRPDGPQAYSYRQYADDALAVMDHVGVGDCVLVGFSMGAVLAAMIAGERAQQVKAVVLIGPVGPTSEAGRAARERDFLAVRTSYEGWDAYNANAFREDYERFVRFFFARMFLEPHSTKQTEDAVAWALETTPQVLIDSVLGPWRAPVDIEAAYRAVHCPSLLIHGDADEIVPFAGGQKVAELIGAEFMAVAGSGHGPHLRYPALVNTAMRRFLERQGLLHAQRPRTPRGSPRALYLSSPIGMGHVRRDMAVARQLRALRPELSIDWLTQDPATRLLARAGETVHAASAALASESRHIEDEAGEHDLDVFQALRRMDEIMVRNFRVFQDVVETGGYDLVIADEGWEVDHFWHEHPHLKRAPLVWLTDFVGFAPMGDAQAWLSADYNAEMVEHVERHPAVRDRAIFVGNPDDVVADRLGPDLPERRAWTQERFAFSGYILGE
ncbi:MAG TPA: alpha/beta hydrolase, partial [Phenylobacterium sp.]